MDSEKRQRLQMAGWTVGNASDFLGLTPAEAEQVELKVIPILKNSWRDKIKL